jgi:ferredoxin
MLPAGEKENRPMVKVTVDAARCQGHTLCNMVAPELFELGDEDGYAYVTHETVEGDLEKLARKAAEGCPERAIYLLSEIHD